MKRKSKNPITPKNYMILEDDLIDEDDFEEDIIDGFSFRSYFYPRISDDEKKVISGGNPTSGSPIPISSTNLEELGKSNSKREKLDSDLFSSKFSDANSRRNPENDTLFVNDVFRSNVSDDKILPLNVENEYEQRPVQEPIGCPHFDTLERIIKTENPETSKIEPKPNGDSEEIFGTKTPEKKNNYDKENEIFGTKTPEKNINYDQENVQPSSNGFQTPLKKSGTRKYVKNNYQVDPERKMSLRNTPFKRQPFNYSVQNLTPYKTLSQDENLTNSWWFQTPKKRVTRRYSQTPGKVGFEGWPRTKHKRFTEDEKRILQDEFDQNDRPDQFKMTLIAQNISCPMKRVYNWFSNQRTQRRLENETVWRRLSSASTNKSGEEKRQLKFEPEEIEPLKLKIIESLEIESVNRSDTNDNENDKKCVSLSLHMDHNYSKASQ